MLTSKLAPLRAIPSARTRQTPFKVWQIGASLLIAHTLRHQHTEQTTIINAEFGLFIVCKLFHLTVNYDKYACYFPVTNTLPSVLANG